MVSSWFLAVTNLLQPFSNTSVTPFRRTIFSILLITALNDTSERRKDGSDTSSMRDFSNIGEWLEEHFLEATGDRLQFQFQVLNNVFFEA